MRPHRQRGEALDGVIANRRLRMPHERLAYFRQTVRDEGRHLRQKLAAETKTVNAFSLDPREGLDHDVNADDGSFRRLPRAARR